MCIRDRPKPFSVSLTAKYHEGPLCFSKDGKQLFFTQNTLVKDKTSRKEKYIRRLRILKAEKNGDEWSKVTNLPFNNDDIDDCHPALTADGKTLIFASSRAGGFGGMDLYKSELVGKQWSTPVNLGAQVNTAGNDLFPFIHEDGTLYYASNGREGEGGLDLFSVDRANGQLGTPINLGVPMNSEKDDFGLILNPEKTSGYFSSSRMNGQGKDDIYYYMLHDNVGTTAAAPTMLTTDICVYDEATEERLSNVMVKIMKLSLIHI